MSARPTVLSMPDAPRESPTDREADEQIPLGYRCLIYTCGGMILLPSIVLLIGGAVVFIDTAEGRAPFIFIGAIVTPVLVGPLLVAEYFAIVRRSRDGALALSLCYLIPVMLLALTLTRGLLGIVGLLTVDPFFAGWNEVAIFVGFMIYSAFLSFGHFQWWRVIKPTRWFPETVGRPMSKDLEP